MIRKIYLVELVDFKYIDTVDNEPVEDRYIIGYFLNNDVLKQALKLCENKKNINEKIEIKSFDFECNFNQQYVYVLFYEYSVLVDDKYVDYYYYFDPLCNCRKCVDLKKRLKKEPKYKRSKYKIYDYKDGFHIEKIKIDFISYINYH